MRRDGERMGRLLRADVMCGLMFVAFAAWGFVAGRDLDPGTAVAMGPGYFPRLVSGLLLALGLAITVTGLAAAAGPGLGSWALRPIVLVSLSALSFAVLLDRAGIVIAIAAVVGIGTFAGQRLGLLPLVLLAAGLIVASVALFVVAIGIPLPIWPRWPG